MKAYLKDIRMALAAMMLLVSAAWGGGRGKGSAKAVLWNSFLWGTGYLGFWAEKWILGKYPYVLAVFGAFALSFYGFGKNRLKTEKELMVSHLIVAAYPLIWYAAAMNHSYIHADVTYRNLGISIFSILCLTEYLCCLRRREGK